MYARALIIKYKNIIKVLTSYIVYIYKKRREIKFENLTIFWYKYIFNTLITMLPIYFSIYLLLKLLKKIC